MDFKKIGIYIALVVALVGGGYAAGRYAAPERVVVTEKIKEVVVEKTVATVDTEKILNALKTVQQQVAQQRDVRTTKTVVKKPDGTVEVRVETADKTKIDTKTDTKVEVQEKDKKTEVTVKEVERVVEKEVTKIVERARPQWALTLQPGFDVAGALGYGTPYSLLPTSNYLLRHVVVGASVERRLLGPLSSGLWANTAGAGGLLLRLEF